MISLQDIHLYFPQGGMLFQDLTLSIPANTFHFLTGPSGVGKSTLLKMIYLNQAPTRGNIMLFEKNADHLTADQAAFLRRKMGIVFQDFRLIDHLTVLENVALPLKVMGLDVPNRRREVLELLEWVGLSDYLHMPPLALSGGQQQRVAIARAIVSRPKLLLADEPTGNLDDQIAFRLLHLFSELHKSGTTVVVATHNRSLARSFPYPELELKKGRIFQKGDTLHDRVSPLA